MILRATVQPAGGTAARQIVERIRIPLDLRLIAQDVARIASIAAQEQVDSQGARAGQAYAPLSRRYAAWKMAQVGAQPILVFSGRLRQTLQRLPQISAASARRIDLTFSALPPYAVRHQAGGRRLPARPIVALTADDRQAIITAYLSAFRRTIRSS